LRDEFMIRESIQDQKVFEKAVAMLNQRGFIRVEGSKIFMREDQNAEFGCNFLCHLVLPFIDSYWLTLTYVIQMYTRKESIGGQELEQRVQWFSETLYSEGYFKFFESCSLESIRNAISTFVQMGIIDQVEKKGKKENIIKYSVSQAFQNEEKLNKVYEELVFFKPYSPYINLPKIQTELRKLLQSDVMHTARL